MSYFMTTIKAGKTIEVYKSFTKNTNRKTKERCEKRKPTQEEIEKVNQINAERKLRILINANFRANDLFVTLTYSKENRENPEKSKKKIEALIRALRKEFKKNGEMLKYVNVTEYKNKAIHHHLLINSSGKFNLAQFIREKWTYGRPQYKLLDSTGQYKDLAAYLIKETSKTYKEKDGGHMQRYSCSTNLIRPKPIVKIVKKANRWSADPKAKKGYFIDKESVYNGINPFTGREFQRYTLVKNESMRM